MDWHQKQRSRYKQWSSIADKVYKHVCDEERVKRKWSTFVDMIACFLFAETEKLSRVVVLPHQRSQELEFLVC